MSGEHTSWEDLPPGAQQGSPERIQGPVQSAITDLIQHIEVAMWAEGIDPETALRVCNRLLFGQPDGTSTGGRIEGIPWWAEDAADGALLAITTYLDAQGEDSEGREKLAALALVRKLLLTGYTTIEQALSSPGEDPSTSS
jgi:hypothetical protein